MSSPVPPSPARRDRAVALVVVALCLVAAILGVVGAALLFGGDDPSAAGADEPEAPVSGAPAVQPSGGSAQVDDGPDSPGNGNGNGKGKGDGRTREPRPTGPTAPTQDAAAAYRCWDGRNTASSADCTTQPDGIRGLRWVFPDAAHCGRMPANGRVVYAACTITASSGAGVEVHYSQWESTAAGHRHYATGKVRKTSRWRGLLRWDLVAQSGSHRFKSALMYPRAPWSVTVYGASDADRDEVLGRLQWRAPRNLRGTSLY